MALSSPFSNNEIIFAYTRGDAIRDGVLIELPQDLVAEAGISVPVAVTQTVWDGYISPPDLDEMPSQSVTGRLWDLLWMFRCAAVRARHTSIIQFSVLFLLVQNETEWGEQMLCAESREQTVLLKAVCGPGDEGEPVITIMLPDED
jgi:hypothetical protein